jgi:hypothetical protein
MKEPRRGLLCTNLMGLRIEVLLKLCDGVAGNGMLMEVYGIMEI